MSPRARRDVRRRSRARSEKAKKLRHFPRGSRDDSARRRHTEEHDAYGKSVLVFLSRAIFHKRRNRYADPPRLVSRAASWESSRVRDSRIRPTRRVRLFSTAELARKDFARNRLRPRFPIRCATDSNDSSILCLWKTETRERETRAPTTKGVSGKTEETETTRRRTASYAPTLLRSASTKKRRGDRNHTSRDSVEDERPPAAVRAPVTCPRPSRGVIAPQARPFFFRLGRRRTAPIDGGDRSINSSASRSASNARWFAAPRGKSAARGRAELVRDAAP